MRTQRSTKSYLRSIRQMAAKEIEKTVGCVAGVSALAGAGMNAAGLYAITNATTGAVMLGSTAAGASAAGTTGIIAGTSGLIGAAGAVLMSPAVIGGCALVAVGVGGTSSTKSSSPISHIPPCPPPPFPLYGAIQRFRSPGFAGLSLIHRAQCHPAKAGALW